MKKTLFCIVALGGLLASCSNDEVVNNAPDAPKTAIGFSTTVDKNSRAVTDITGDNIPSFKVWGYESASDDATNVATRFNGVTVTKNGSNWEYDPLQYWTAGNFYWFVGYNTNNAAAAKFIADGTKWPATAVTPSTDQLFGGTMYFNNGSESWTPAEGVTLSGAQGDADLVYAWWKTDGAVVKGSEPTVDFAFKHILSKVAFKFVNELPYSTIEISALKVTSVGANGTLDMTTATPAWNVEGSYDMNYADDISALAAIAPAGNATSAFNIFIPADFTYNIEFTVNVSQSGVPIATYNHTVNVSNLTLEMGKAYVLTATLNTGNIDPAGALVPIKFNPTVSNWTPAGANVNVPAE